MQYTTWAEREHTFYFAVVGGEGEPAQLKVECRAESVHQNLVILLRSSKNLLPSSYSLNVSITQISFAIQF